MFFFYFYIQFNNNSFVDSGQREKCISFSTFVFFFFFFYPSTTFLPEIVLRFAKSSTSSEVILEQVSELKVIIFCFC